MKAKKLMIVMILVFAALIALSACGKKINSIEIDTLPTKTAYFTGDQTLDLTGGKIIVKYKNSKTTMRVDMTSDDVTVTGFETATAGTKTLTVEYQGFETTFDIEVSKTITGISVYQEPTKLVYPVGDTLDLTGGTIKVTYDDDTFSEIPMTNAMVQSYSFSEIGTVTITLRYAGFNAYFDVEVIPALVKIEITSAPTKSVYEIDEELDVTGGKIKLTYSDGSTVEIDMDADGVSLDYDFSAPDDEAVVTVEFGGKSASFTVKVNFSIPEFIRQLDDLLSATLVQELLMQVYYRDCTTFLIYFTMLEDMVDELYSGAYADWIIKVYEEYIFHSTEEDIYPLVKYFDDLKRIADIIRADLEDNGLTEIYATFFEIANKYYSAGGSVSEQLNTFSRSLYENFDEEISAFDSLLFYLPWEKQAKFYYYGQLFQYTMLTSHYSLLLTEAEYQVFLQLFNARIRYLVYMGDETLDTEFIIQMGKCITMYMSLEFKDNFDAVLLEEYELYKGIYYEIGPDEIYDWAYMEYVINGCFVCQDYEQDTLFLYFWFEFDRMAMEIYSSSNPEWLSFFNENYSGIYYEFSAFFFGYYYEYSPDVFDDPVLYELLLLHVTISYTWEMGENYPYLDPAYTMLVFDYMGKYNALSLTQKAKYLLTVIDFSYYYVGITYYFYKTWLSAEIVDVYYFLAHSEFYYAYYMLTGDKAAKDIFIEAMALCVESHGYLVDDDYYVFDDNFGEMYRYYFAIYDSIVKAAGYDWNYLDMLVARLNWFKNIVDSDSAFLHYYLLFEEALDYIESLGDAGVNNYLNENYGLAIATYTEYFATNFYAVAPDMFDDEEILEVLKAHSYLANSYVWGYSEWWPYNPAILDELISGYIELFRNLSDAQKAQLLLGVSDFTYYYLEVTRAYYGQWLSSTEIYGIYTLLTEAEMAYYYYITFDDDAKLAVFMEKMASCITAYETCSETFKTTFGDLFNDFKEIYEDLLP